MRWSNARSERSNSATSGYETKTRPTRRSPAPIWRIVAPPSMSATLRCALAGSTKTRSSPTATSGMSAAATSKTTVALPSLSTGALPSRFPSIEQPRPMPSDSPGAAGSVAKSTSSPPSSMNNSMIPSQSPRPVSLIPSSPRLSGVAAAKWPTSLPQSRPSRMKSFEHPSTSASWGRVVPALARRPSASTERRIYSLNIERRSPSRTSSSLAPTACSCVT